MSHEDPLVDARITRRRALIGAGTAALGVSLFGPSALQKFTPFADAAAAATAGSPFAHMLRPDTNLDSLYPSFPSFPNQAYIESFIHAATGLTSTPGATPAQYAPKYGPKWFAYVKAGSVYRAEVGGDPGDMLYGTDPLVLKDTLWNRPIIGPVTGSEYMPDLTNATFRNMVIDICLNAIDAGHRGIWLDNVLNPIYSYSAQPTVGTTTMLGKPYTGTGPGSGQTPQAKRANGTVVTTAQWNDASAQLMTELRAALGPTVPILANVPWYAPWDEGDGLGGNFSNASFVTVAQKATYLDREGWVRWGPNLMDGWNMSQSLNIIEGARAAVPTVAFTYDSFPANASDNTHREYALAMAYLVSNGADLFGDATYYGTNDWVGYHIDLGAPSTGRTVLPGTSYAWKRTFANGIVIANAESTSVSVTLPAGVTYWKLDNSTVSGTITVPAQTGLILHTYSSSTPTQTWSAFATLPATVNLTSDSTFGLARDWRQFYGTSPSNSRFRNALPQALPTWTQQGVGTPSTFTSQHTTFSWTNTTGSTPSGNTQVGVALSGNGVGFQLLTKMYKGEPRTIKLFVGVRGAATVARATSNYGAGTGGIATLNGTSDTDTIDRVVTLTTAPMKPSDTLTLKWVQTSGNAASKIVLYGVQLF